MKTFRIVFISIFKKNLKMQDHVAATFGAGLGYACVVDVGDQKTSVSCVEDGISHPSTRVCSVSSVLLKSKFSLSISNRFMFGIRFVLSSAVLM